MSATKGPLLEQENLGNLNTYRTLSLPSMNVPVSQGSSENDLNRVFSENVLYGGRCFSELNCWYLQTAMRRLVSNRNSVDDPSI
jgi:hypothetical protein